MNREVDQLEKLRPASQPFSHQADQAVTLPASFYYDPEIYQQEKYAIFYKTWHYAGHISQLDNPGCYITTQIHEQNIFVMRDDSGELNGFYNVCQHRGHELLKGQGQVKSIVCPYHAWSYKKNGELAYARNSENVENFQACEFSLKPVKVEVFLGMVMVNCDLEAGPFGEMVEGLEEEIRAFVPDIDTLIFAQRQQYDVKCNWKVIVDNFLECYHCHIAHEAFVDLVNMQCYRSEVKPYYSNHISNQPAQSKGKAYTVSTDVDFSFAAWFVWPNITIWVMPGEANVSVLQMNPFEEEKTIEYLDWFLTSTELSPEMQQASDYFDAVLQPEDISLCESVQRGLKSIGYNQGRFVVDKARSELSEHAVHHFQSLVMKALGF